MNILQLLKKPHPFIFNIGSILVPALITFLVILVFAPFGLVQSDVLNRFSYAIFFSAVVAFCIWVGVRGLQKVFSNSFEEENWTVGKEISLVFTILTFIIFVTFFIFAFLKGFENLGALFQIMFVRTLLISFFPILIMILYEQYYHQKQKWKEAESLNQRLQEKQTELQETQIKLKAEFENKLQNQVEEKIEEQVRTKVEEIENTISQKKIILEAENGKIALQLESKQIFYLQSEGNYIEVFYKSDNSIQKELIRNSLKKLEEKLPPKDFFRCHKSYIINLSKIQKVEGNARNLELVLQNINTKIPVSRSKSKELSELLKANS
ncbi:LytTR family transcriptional regulator DNA-binding domain-containing protein [Bernardetia sp. Wsw4-3y2]|uniref:LytR/AlgR family response regulator transcription factor n=1 Tax=Bernardetia sp. Wsw4-3y2 TaxID=3127471 RepID=UPI0030CBD636